MRDGDEVFGIDGGGGGSVTPIETPPTISSIHPLLSHSSPVSISSVDFLTGSPGSRGLLGGAFEHKLVTIWNQIWGNWQKYLCILNGINMEIM